MASRRRASLIPTDFRRLIFGDGYLALTLCIPVYEQLERDPGQISRILADDDILVKFLSNFDLYAARISQFFRQLKAHSIDPSSQRSRRRSTVGHGLTEELVESFLLPLLGDDFEHYRLNLCFHDLFVSIIDYSLPFRSRSLEVLARRLVDIDGRLLEALVSGEASSEVMKEWTRYFSTTIFDVKILEAWTRRIIRMCSSCDSNHKVSEQISTWRKIEDLKSQLAEALQTCNQPEAARNLAATKRMRKLRDIDKKTNIATQKSGPGLQLTPEIVDALRHFQIQQPASERALLNAIEQLEKNQTLEVLQAAINSFPCRPCYETSTNPSVAKSYSEQIWETGTPESDAAPIMFTELLGRGLGIWRVFLSSQALKDLEQSRFEGNFRHVETKLVQLASGEWRRRSLCTQAGNQNERKSCQGTLYEAVYGSNGRILWQVDVEFDERSGCMMQLVKVWKIGDVKEISKSIPNVLRVQKTYSPSRMEACKRVLFDESTGRNMPAECSFESSLNAIGDSTVEPITSEYDDQKILQNQFLTNKFFQLTQTIIDNLVSQNLQAEFPLVLSAEELEIIKNSTTSTLILGRSGTGKTTCLVYKLFGRYLTGNNLRLTRPRHQVLLTRSSVLSEKLELYTKRLIDTQLNRANSSGKSEGDRFRAIAEEDKEITDTIFSIKDEDFPLVCTFDHFMKLLENTTKAANRQDFSISKQQTIRNSDNITNVSRGDGQRRLFRRSHVVDFGMFSTEYWPSFPSKLTKRIPVTLAFMEIIGVIKGSASATNNFLPLGRDEYRTSGSKISPTFMSSGDRDLLYDIYENYERKKHKLGDVDDTDRARSVLVSILNDSELKEKLGSVLDEIYVDEIQDQRLLEIKLLLHLVKNPLAIHFAGDTAQCISKDSAFRFQNVKALFFDHFSRISAMANSPELSRPKLCELYKNYRTHQGILSLATCVMRLLYRTFPNMVDLLRDEVGQHAGPKPMIFVGFGTEIFASKMIGIVDLHADISQFGAEQVIIVRDIAEKEKLKAEIGQVALVLTILESKGMEFEDVLLHDFFATSECVSAFRALALPGHFDEMKHVALCSELKQFYVAITRARSRLWIFESDRSRIEPVMESLATKEKETETEAGPITLFEVVHTGDHDVAQKLKQLRPGTTTDPKAWSAKGDEFIHKKDYENALFCFGRAKDQKGENLAMAFVTEKKGRFHLSKGDVVLSERFFREAIKLFHQSELPLREAACFEALGEFESAAEIFSQNGEFSRAAELFDGVDSFEKAAENYRLSGRYNEGAAVLRRGNCFDKLVYYLNDNCDSLDSRCRSHYSRLCNLLLKRGKISPELKELTMAALGSDREKEAFFLEYEMTEQLFTFYTSKHRFREAFSLAFKTGDLDKSWSILKDDDGYSGIPRVEAVEVLCYIQARNLHSSLSTGFGPLFLLAQSQLEIYSWASGISLFWKYLGQSLYDMWTHSVSYETIKFDSQWMKQFFDILVTFKAHELINSAETMGQLPIDSINEILKMLKQIVSVETLPAPLLRFLGVFPIPQEAGSFLLLDWSPLCVNNSSRTLDSTSTLRQVTKWGLNLVYSAVNQLHDKALELYSAADPIRCVQFLATGHCGNIRCLWSHKDQTTLSEYTTSVENLLRLNSVFCSLLPIYNYRFQDPELMDNQFAASFRGRHRKWQEFLLAKITYTSTFEAAPSTLMNTRRHISKRDPRVFGISGVLESLLFHRLKRNWEGICDFSSMLEQMELAETLGVRDRFWRSLSSEVHWRQYYNSWGSVQSTNAWGALNDIGRLLGPETISGNLVTSVLQLALQRISAQEMSSFHAICSLYERIATFLVCDCTPWKIISNEQVANETIFLIPVQLKICMSNPTSLFLPNGWVEMHLLQMRWLSTRKDNPQPPQSRRRYQEALLALIRTFYYLMQKISNEPGFQHKFSGKLRPWHLLVRRNVDFLTVCMINAYSWRPTAGDLSLSLVYDDTWNCVRRAFGLRFSSAPEFQGCSEFVLARKFVYSFDSFPDKDFPVILIAEADTMNSFTFLERLGASTLLLDSLQSLSTPSTNISLVENNNADDESGDYAQLEIEAAGKIQRLWRTRYPIVLKRREFSKTPTGQAISYIQKLCTKYVEGRTLNQKERLMRRSVLFSDGIDIFQHTKKIEQQFREVKKAVSSMMDNSSLDSTTFMEIFQEQWEKLPKIRDDVRRNAGFLSEKNFQELDISGKKLSWKCQEIKLALQNLETKLRGIILAIRVVA